jgi:putative PIN family toxin of toxin-antitoxin system
VIKSVFDTNVLASGFLSQAGAPGQLMSAWRDGTFELVVSAPILEELGRTFNAPYLCRRLTLGQIERNLDLLRREATVVLLTTKISGVATHPEDDLILATALTGQTQYLVTGDAQLLGLGSFSRVVILSPRTFLDVVRQ